MIDANTTPTSEEVTEGDTLAGYTCDLTEVAQQRVKPGPKGGTWMTATYEGILVGRNKVIIEPNQVYELAKLGLKSSEIANFFGVTIESINRYFASEMEKGREHLKISLRRAMLNNAIAHNNAAVQIFLSKNLLGFSDNPTNAEDAVPLPWVENTEDENHKDVD